MRLMAEIPEVNVPPDFRDRVVRAWRLKRDRVQNSIPFSTLRYVQIIFALFLIAVLSLPASRISLLSAASDLSSAINNLPPEYRQGVQISFEIPSYAQSVATLQTWIGQLFEWLANFGSALAPWTTWLLAILIISAFVASIWLWRTKKAVSDTTFGDN